MEARRGGDGMKEYRIGSVCEECENCELVQYRPGWNLSCPDCGIDYTWDGVRGDSMKEEEDFYVECIACGWIVLSRQSCDCVEVKA
jgi:ribosomal protein S27E